MNLQGHSVNMNQSLTAREIIFGKTEKEKFTEKPLLCFRRNRNLRDIPGQTRISQNKVLQKKQPTKGRCTPCRTSLTGSVTFFGFVSSVRVTPKLQRIANVSINPMP